MCCFQGGTVSQPLVGLLLQNDIPFADSVDREFFDYERIINAQMCSGKEDTGFFVLEF